MDETVFAGTMASFNRKDLFHQLVEFNFQLNKSIKSDVDFDYSQGLRQLLEIIEKFNIPSTKTKKKGDASETDPVKAQESANVFRLLSRNLVLLLSKLPNKTYDVANNLLNHLALDSTSELPAIGNLAAIVLTDLFEAYPQSLTSLINFSVSQIYKIIKKDPGVNANLVNLLSSLTKYSTRADIDDKLQAKLLKIITKNITSLPVEFELPSSTSQVDNTAVNSISLKKNYILVLKNISILSVSSNYEQLLALSASTTSAGAKMKPETIMTQQHHFQTTLLSNITKVVVAGFHSFSKDVRIATVECLANLFINFIPTGKFNPIDYLVDLYLLPPANAWSDDLTSQVEVDLMTDTKKDLVLDSEERVVVNTNRLLYNLGVVETFIFYIQLEQFQNPDYLTSNLAYILEAILNKFGTLNAVPNHVQNNNWVKVLEQWVKVFDYIVKESGTTCHDILLNFLFNQFKWSSERAEIASIKEKKSTGLLSLTKSRNSSKNNKEANVIMPYHNSYQAYLLLSIVQILLPFGIDFNSFIQEKDNAELDSQQTQPEDENDTVDDGKKIETTQDSYLVNLLFQLSINQNYYIRNYALETLSKYAAYNEVEVNQLVLACFSSLNGELSSLQEAKSSNSTMSLDTNTSPLSAARFMSYALALLTLVKNADSINLQNSTIVKVLSFCTQNLKHNNANTRVNCYKNSACWVILSSLVTLYNESEFVKLNSSQLLVFWKSLLTSQYVSSSLSGATEDGEKREVIDNLKLRNVSLICLLNYLNTVDLTPESLKQLQFLLTKAYNYLTYLESNHQVIGDITNFNSTLLMEDLFNMNAASNLIFSNYNVNSKVQYKDAIINLILYGKKIILSSFAKLATLLKNDINSSMVVFLIRLFSSPTLFAGETKEKFKVSKSRVPPKIQDLDSSLIILDDDTSYCFGVTSKFTDTSYEIDNLNVQTTTRSRSSRSELSYLETFMKETQAHKEIDADNTELIKAWFDELEETVFRSSTHSINYEPCILLLLDYSSKSKYATSLITSLVDLSIELFQLVFPYLTPKIQSSLLEQIRSSLTSKSVSPLRYKAICVNISTAINGALLYTRSRKATLDKEIVTVVVDVLRKIDTSNKTLIELNAESTGIACALTEKKQINDILGSLVSQIINDNNPYGRGKDLLAIAMIFQYTGVGASDVYNAAFQLINDPNPIVYYYSVLALTILFNNSMTNTHWIIGILDRLHETYLNDSFGYDISNKIFVNLKYKFSSVGVIAKLIKVIVTILGPNLRGLPENTRSILKDLIVGLRFSIGSGSIDDSIIVTLHMLALLQELIIFDSSLINDDVTFYTLLLNSVISKNLKLGLATPSATSINLDAIFPYNSSFGLYRLAYACLSELLKVHGRELLTKEDVQLAWVSLNIKPCEESKQLMILWMESSPDMNWFATLNSLFKMSAKKLSGPFIDANFLQKLLPLLQRQKKKNNAPIDFKDEEIENIVAEDGDNSDKNEPISWEFKLFIHDLLNNLLDLASKDSTLFTRLKARIPDLVKIAFLGSTAPINTIKLSGINLLNKVLGLYGDLEDPFYPGTSILEQQQAQIISALVPCFNNGSNAKVIVNAINVSSKFINLPRMKFYSKQRILKTLIYFLEELSSNKFLRFGYLENMSEFGKKSIQVSILNCWALVKLDCGENQEGSEPELVETLNKYSTLLVSLWIISLKEYSTLKYTESNSRELEIYSNYWVNFISVLSFELEANHRFVDEHLQGDASTFFFILFSQCIEALIRNRNITEVLRSLNSLVKNPELVEILFHNEIFGEVVDLFDRLILIDDNTEIQCELVDIVGTVFRTYTINHKDMTAGFDKLFELVRLCMLPLFNILPFLRADYDPEDKATQLILRDSNRGPHLVVLRSALQQLVEMVEKFPDIVKQDLYSCILYIFAKFYEYGNEMLISTILPYLKQVVRGSRQLDVDIVGPFYDIISQYFSIDKSNSFSILTTMVLATVGEVSLDDTQSQALCTALIDMIQQPELVAMSIQCIKSLVQYSGKSLHDLLVVKLLVKEVVRLTVETNEFDKKVGLEILILLVRSELTNSAKVRSIYKLVIPLILKVYAEKLVSPSYLNEKLLALIDLSPAVFKEIVNDFLTPAQKLRTEELVKLSANSGGANDDSEIQLKTFG